MADSQPLPLPSALRQVGRPATPGPADTVAARVVQLGLQANPPGQWAANKWEQLNHFTGVVSIAIRPYIDALGAARFVVLQKKNRVTKSVAGAGHYSRDDEYEPADADHPLCHVLEHPGGEGGAWSMQQECAYLLLQKLLTGDAPMWFVPNEDGRPCQVFALTGASVSANFSLGVGGNYPNGSYRVIQAVGNTMWFAGLGATTAVIPAEQLYFLRDPHPLWRNAGMSRLQCGALEVDVLEAITRSRWSFFDQGAQLGTVVYIPGATEDQCRALQADFVQKQGGARNAHKVMVVGGAGAFDSGGKPLNVQNLSPSARELDFQSSYEQAAKVVAALFKVPGTLLGLTESGSSYAADWAAQRRFYDLGLSVEARNLGAFLTRHLAGPWCEFPGQYRVEVEIDPPQNVEAEGSERQFALQQGVISVNEYRRATNRKPVDEGDEPQPVYLAKLQQAAQPQPDPMAALTGGGKPPGGDGPDPGDPLAGLLERTDGPDEPVLKAEHQGREVTLNKPFRLPKGSGKKFGVYVKDGGSVRKVTFGDPNMEIKRDSPGRKKNFRARHNCDTATDKTTARYWSCRKWKALPPDLTDADADELDAVLKAMSAYCDSTGGALVPPAGAKAKRRKRLAGALRKALEG